MKGSLESVTYFLPPAQLAAADTDPGTASVAGAFQARLAELVSRHVDGAPGFLMLTGLGQPDLERAKALVLTVSETVGRLLPQDAKGTILRQVVDRGVRLGEGKTGRYSDSRQGGSLHTDGPHVPPPVPDCFALYCVHQARVGGELCLVHVDELVDRLPGWAFDALQSEFHFDRREANLDEPTVVRPILSKTTDGIGACYLREYIEIAHRRKDVPALTAEQRNAMDLLDSLLEDPKAQVRGRLAPGDLALFNNRVLLHGRTEFKDDPGSAQKRLMLRTWIQRHG